MTMLPSCLSIVLIASSAFDRGGVGTSLNGALLPSLKVKAKGVVGPGSALYSVEMLGSVV